MRLGTVYWEDASGGAADWQAVPTEPRLTPVESHGYIIELQNWVIVVPNYAPYVEGVEGSLEQCFGRVDIPRGCVTRIEYRD